MIKPEYKRELSHSYLILENIPKDKMDNYQCRMILKNKIPGLLCSSERFILVPANPWISCMRRVRCLLRKYWE